MKRKIAVVLAFVLLLTAVMPGMTSFASNSVETTSARSASALQAAAQTRYNAVMAAGVEAIEYSANWYENVTPVELGARLIYAEAPYWKADKQGVAWVLWYRRQSSSFPNTFYDIAVQSGQFAVITGGVNADYDERVANTERARIVDTTSAAWQNSLMYACILWAAAVEGHDPSLALPIPSEYTNQMYFCSYWSFFGSASDDVNGQPKKSGQNIYKIWVPVLGEFSTVAGAKAAYDNPNNIANGRPAPQDLECVNVYYNWSP